jgi:hypothetical protein
MSKLIRRLRPPTQFAFAASAAAIWAGRQGRLATSGAYTPKRPRSPFSRPYQPLVRCSLGLRTDGVVAPRRINPRRAPG